MRKQVQAKDLKPGEEFFLLEGSNVPRVVLKPISPVCVDGGYMVYTKSKRPVEASPLQKEEKVWVEVKTVPITNLVPGEQFRLPNQNRKWTVCKDQHGLRSLNHVLVREGNVVSEFMNDRYVILVEEEE